MSEREPLTADELQAVAEALVAEPIGWVPHDEHLPLAERLVGRGIFSRIMRAGEATYRISAAFNGALALDQALGRAEASLN
jgi:hypothetical protein